MEEKEKTKLIQTVGEAVKTIRENSGLTQDQLAKKIQSSDTAISQVETGRRAPGLLTLYRLKRGLNCDWEMLLGE